MFCPCDLYAAAVLEDPSSRVVARSERLLARVEVGGSLARGMVAFDWRRKGAPNVTLVQRLHDDRLRALMTDAFGAAWTARQ